MQWKLYIQIKDSFTDRASPLIEHSLQRIGNAEWISSVSYFSSSLEIFCNAVLELTEILLGPKRITLTMLGKQKENQGVVRSERICGAACRTPGADLESSNDRLIYQSVIEAKMGLGYFASG